MLVEWRKLHFQLTKETHKQRIEKRGRDFDQPLDAAFSRYFVDLVRNGLKQQRDESKPASLSSQNTEEFRCHLDVVVFVVVVSLSQLAVRTTLRVQV